MDFEWDPESRSLRAAAFEFGQSLNAGALEDDRAGRFREDKWERLAEWGYLGLCAPKQFGGAGADPLTGLLVTEALAESCQDGGLLFSAAVQAWVVMPALLRHGSEEHKRRYLPALVDGSSIGAIAITEPEAGSDAFAMRTRATSAEGGFSLHGRKTMVTNGPVADVVVCFAATGDGAAASQAPLLGGTSVFVVDTATPGVERSRSIEKMGLRTSPLGDLVFEGAFVPENQVLGRLGAGLLVFNDVIEWERIWLSALQLGALQRDLDQARSYARERKAFGAPIASFQSVANRIVDMKVRLEASRWLLYHAAWTKTHKGRALAESAIAKLSASEAALESSLDALQVHGGYGYMTESGLERRVRDAVGSRIYSGTSEMQRVVLSRALGL
jgi:alkylation response protein AidB-like acyl-CoA dehydrogenase